MSRRRTSTINVYIALADMYMNLGVAFVMIALIYMLLGTRGWEDVRYRMQLEQFSAAVQAEPALALRIETRSRHDAPGEQRWMFPGAMLFEKDTSTLTQEGRSALLAFANLLRRNRELWWRLRVEAHTRRSGTAQPSPSEERHALHLTAARAVEVAIFLQGRGGGQVEPWRIVASGRGYQDLLDRDDPTSVRNDRVDVLLLPRSVADREP